MSHAIAVPPSKSMTQRALVLAALADSPTTVVGPLDCDDSRRLREVLAALGATIEASASGDALRILPAPLPLRGSERALFCGNAGTVVRFAAPLSLLCEGALHLDGDEHMRRRPLGPLTTALAALGVEARHLAAPGCPPVMLRRASEVGASVTVDASLSSQFVSGLLLVAPLLPQGLRISQLGEAVSRSYVAMTVAMMRDRGCALIEPDARTFVVSCGRPQGGTIAIEPDWSAAAFILAAARITGLDLTPASALPAAASLQGDAAVTGLLERLDAGSDEVFDLTDVPDLIAPLTVAALFASGSTRIRGAAHTRVKESDRVAVLARELRKIGATIEAHDDGLDVEPLRDAPSAPVELDPDGDHRMAMAFGLVSLAYPRVTVSDPDCVTKSFPTFWAVLEEIRRMRR